MSESLARSANPCPVITVTLSRGGTICSRSSNGTSACFAAAFAALE
ncbi:hypothetical protein ACFQL4_06475 [Halosimplex aquaticum]